jgi:nitrous oxide reductase accessory protein NosL
MIKKLLILSILFFSSTLQANEMFSKMVSEPMLVQEGAKKHWCLVCGMSLKMFYKTSHVVDKKQFCSMRCLIVDMQDNNISLNSIQVVDVKTEKLILAKDAFYVMGSDVMGTMSKISKLAFAEKKDANNFVAKHGGEIVSFQKVLDLAKKSLEFDISMVMKKKQKKMYPMGKKLYEAKCQQDINLNQYKQINELKSAIKTDKLCKDLKGKRLHAVSLYLWEVKRATVLTKSGDAIEVKKEDKCPVCGMFVYKYPKWVAQLYYRDTNYSFDGVKDMIKFYFEPTKWGKYENKRENITKILVTDYYSQKVIDGKEAFYVIGSDVAGPMGNELIPFAQESDAKTFSIDHNGKKIVKFDKIVEKEVYKLDE